MQARTTFPRGVNPAIWTIGLLGLALLAGVSLALLDLLSAGRSTGLATAGARVAYFEFAAGADTLWLADLREPTQREKLLVVAHAREYGVVPSLAPNGQRFAYTSLPPNTLAPSPDAPADLWLAALNAGAKPRRLAQGVDLLVRAVWSRDGDTLVFRRSPSTGRTGYQLFVLDVGSGEERLLVASDNALFPVAFAPASAASRAGDSRLYYVQLQRDGSDLFALDLPTGARVHVARLADGLTRDWALSPDGDHLAYLVMNLAPDRVSSRAFLLELASGSAAPLGEADADAFSPVWSAAGELVIGRLSEGEAGLLRVAGGDAFLLPGPPRGFDVPLAFASAGGFIVRSFEGVSVTAPGRAVLAFVGADGRRLTIASGEVTFLGWITL